MSKRRTFRVTFTDTRYMRIDLKAGSPQAAIKAAERLYIEGDPCDRRFVDWGGEAFHDPDVEEVQS